MSFGNWDFEVKLFATWNGNGLVNTFFYQDTAEEADANAVGQMFGTDVVPAIAAIVTSTTNFNRLYVRNLAIPDDFDDVLLDMNGGRGGNANSLVERWYFKYYRHANGNSDGRKMIGMIANGDVQDGHVVDVAPPPLDDCESALSSSLSSIVGNCVPCNGRYFLNDPDVDHEKPWYSLDSIEIAKTVRYVGVSPRKK